MAGDWIKMRINLDTDPRVIEMARVLETNELHVVGMLWKVWAWADSHSLDGNALSVTDVTLDRFTSAPGFAAALRNVGWLNGRDGALTFPRFAEHNGQTAKTRANTQKRVSKHRNDSVTLEALPEKRREEKRREDTKSARGSPSRFDEFWAIVPRKASKGQAVKAYGAAVRKLASREDDPEGFLVSRMKVFASSPKAKGEFCPYPATWLNQERYDDADSEWNREDGKPQRGRVREGGYAFLPGGGDD